ncbi:MAG: LysR family transcriptional regulator [Myxococcota bacterium]
MQLKQLQHFETLYRLQSFVRAAEEHRITQPALSRSIKNLEGELGQRLFDRTTHAVEPTDAARGLIQSARDVLSALASFEEEAGRLRGGATGHVRIGTGPYPAQPLLTRAIRRLSASHHGIQVSVVAGTSRDLLAALLGRELEFVVCDMSKYEDSPAAEDIEVIPLPSEALVAVMADDHPLATGWAALDEVASFPWAMPTPAPIGTRELPAPFDEAFEAGRFPFYRLENTAACLELARAGRAVTLVPHSLAEEACARGGLVQRPALPSLRTNDGIHLVRNRTRSPSVRVLIDEIRDVAESIARSPGAAPAGPESRQPASGSATSPSSTAASSQATKSS